jgi:Transport and Golgi organisation 2
VCSVVVRWSRGWPTRILALRDELVGRDFDDPGRWWPEYPDVVGGRDRAAGGAWCATRIDTGTTALVLNRPQKRLAEPGSPSRGVLPLLGAMYEGDWLSHVDLAGMASFLLVLAMPERLITWDFDGAGLRTTEHAEGTIMITSGGPEDRKAERHLSSFRESAYPEGWRRLVQARPPSDDLAALVVRRKRDGAVYGTVFGQLLEAEPGRVRLEYSRRPWRGDTWTVLDR